MDEIKGNNMKEHLILLRAEVAKESHILNHVKNEVLDLEFFLKELVKRTNKEVSLAWEEVLKTRNSLLSDRAKLEDEIIELRSEEKIFSEEKRDFDLFVTKTKQDLSHITALHEETRAKYLKSIDALEEEEDTKMARLDDLDDQEDLLNQNIKSLQVKLSGETEEYLRTLLEKNILKAELKELQEQLSQLEVLTKKEAGKISNNHAGLEERELELEKREKNYAILKARLAKAFALLYPNQNIDNLL